MIPSVLMNLDFAATAVTEEPPVIEDILGLLLLLGVGR